METGIIERFRNRVSRNLYENIIPFWTTHAVDRQYGGFYGRITNDLRIEKDAPRGLILIGRILWTFSALYRFEARKDYLAMAQRAYQYLIEKFIDRQYGGAFWMVSAQGEPTEYLKKIYGQAFTIYALSEYFAATNEKSALEEALNIFNLLERYCHDPIHNGYFEAANRNWSPTENMQLSAVDLNEKKSMNSHLHLTEAFTSLLRVCDDGLVRRRLEELIECHFNYIINPDTYHLELFFDECWNRKSDVISFGHDIEASWLLCEAADVLGNRMLIDRTRQTALKMVGAVVAEGFSALGGLNMEKDSAGNLLQTHFDWWPQAEAVVGLINAYELSGKAEYFEKALQVWNFIEKYFVDTQYGEWFYEISATGVPNPNRYKASEWKCPYHNTRTCLEVLKRTAGLL
jgi:mannobiose 2-epimerase